MVELPVSPALKEILDATLVVGGTTFLVTEFGKPFSAAGFGNWFRHRCDEAGLAHCSAHGVRKASAAHAAENGATVHQLMAMFGWPTMREAERYTREAQRRKLAADASRLLARDAKPEHRCPTTTRTSVPPGANSSKNNSIIENWCPRPDSNGHAVASTRF